jgi:A/G-specific adenine glycosylase
MTEVPTSDWLAAQDDATALKQAPFLGSASRWRRKAGTVTHVFTHFPLELAVYIATTAARTRAPKGLRWVPIATLKDEALPNLMRKVIAHGLEHDPDPKGRASAKGKPVFGQDLAQSKTGGKI